MATRLEGSALRFVARAARCGPVARLLLSSMAREYGIPALLALGAEHHRPPDATARPLEGAPPRRGSDARLGPPPPHPLSARRLRAAFLESTSNPEEVLDRLVGRLEARDLGLATHSPFVALDLEGAREAARTSALRYRAGASLGPLDGIPVPVKDEHDMKGLPTGGGTAYRTTAATTDSFAVKCLRASGAVLPGKTHATEWGMCPVGRNPHVRMPRNVRDADRAGGGSSTGSAAAVALGLAPVAVGSDGGGSIRVPSALQGIFGLKPTFGRVGRTGDIFGTGTMSHIGPIGASTADLVDLLGVLAATADPDDEPALRPPDLPDPGARWEAALGRGVTGVRIGVPEAEWADADDAVVGPCRAALQALESEGARLVPVSLPLLAHAPALGVVVIATETMGALQDDVRQHLDAMGDDLQVLLAVVGQIRARDYLLGLQVRAALRRAAAATLADLDLLALPATRTLAPSHPLTLDGVAVQDSASTRAMCRYAFFGNLTGLPAGSVPVGTSRGLAVGLQFVGDAWDEASVLAAMAHVERIGLAAIPPPPSHPLADASPERSDLDRAPTLR
ncbi:MAG: amidase [Deltaproteobacteria bacterium]|nr:amidase [Deltaproteobacteria bacterium]